MSDMTTITMRTLSRETARVLDELGTSPQGVIVTRDGVPCARVVALSPVELAMCESLIERGLDASAPPTVRQDLVALAGARHTGASASALLLDDRASYYTEP